MTRYRDAAERLHAYLVARHWRGDGLVGPDPGVRFAYRIGRFIKSYARWVAWQDDYYYLQAQGYWVLGNWMLFAETGGDGYRELAIRGSRRILAEQRADGAWEYPHVEWRGRIATIEGIWAALALVESYRRTTEPLFLHGARRWHAFVAERIGFRVIGDGLAVNYFAGQQGLAVPNNSACALRFLAELAAATDDTAFLKPCAGMLAFLAAAQTPTGEFPYAVDPNGAAAGRGHFQCYQYNAFQLLDLLRYRELTGDSRADPLLRGLLAFLRTGVAEDGHAYYSCSNRHGAVTYHAAVVGAALLSAGALGEPGDFERGQRALAYVLGVQRPSGRLPHSRGDYRLLRDDRSYPRYLAMIAYHLLLAEAAVVAPATAGTPS